MTFAASDGRPRAIVLSSFTVHPDMPSEPGIGWQFLIATLEHARTVDATVVLVTMRRSAQACAGRVPAELEHDGIEILVVGHLITRKRQELAIEALASTMLQNAHLHMVGPRRPCGGKINHDVGKPPELGIKVSDSRFHRSVLREYEIALPRDARRRNRCHTVPNRLQNPMST